MGFRDKFKKVFGSGKGENAEIPYVDKVESSPTEEFGHENVELSPNGNVLFVCGDNTVISPIAEAIFNQMSEDRKAFSAGFSIGDDVVNASTEAAVVCAIHGIDLSDHKPHGLKDFPIDEMELVLTSTALIRNELKGQYPNSTVFTIMEYVGNDEWDIMQPFGSDMVAYNECFSQILEAVSKIARGEKTVEKPIPVESSDDESHGQPTNFRFLDNLIHSGAKRIVLSSDITLDDYESTIYGAGIKIDVDDIVIDGAGHTIDAKGNARIFECTGSNITIKNISLKNGFKDRYPNRGAGIYNTGNLTIADSTLSSNNASDGGAIYNSGELTIIGSALDGNEADKGGAIYNFENLAIIDSLIEGNRAWDGGAIYNSGNLTIIDSALNGNEGWTGGAINHQIGELIIENSMLNDNTAQNGGAAYALSILSILSSSAKGNAASGSGGFLYNTFGSVTSIEDSTLYANSAEKDGGAIYNKNGRLNIEKTSFCENLSKETGGAIYNIKNLNILNCKFLNNKSPECIVDNRGYMQVLNSSFKTSQSKHCIVNSGKGGIAGIFNGEFKDVNAYESVIFNDGKSCTIEKGIFQDCLSNGDSLNIINRSDAILTTPRIKDEGRTILNEGHVFVKNPSDGFLDKIFGTGVMETNLHPGGEHADFECLDERIHINHDYEDEWVKITLTGNVKEIELKSDFSLRPYEYEFYEGGIELSMDNVVVDGGGKTIDGMGRSRIFIISGKNVTLKNMTFKDGHSYSHLDSSNSNGGAIRINRATDVTIENCRFITNISEGLGGAIYNRDGELNIAESAFCENASQDSGGAISHMGNLTIEESMLIENTSQRVGGAISIAGISCIKSTELNQNTADSGGAISNSGKLTIRESVLQQNSAKSHYGGAIDNGEELTVINSKLNGNVAECDGGAIHNNCADLLLIGSSFSGNKANERGDAIFNYRENSFKQQNCDLDYWDVEKYNEYDGGD